ncbi:MAG TPA: 3-oxoadipate enol-lactonase [Baekduia sp.]|uniref:3-oxoadipate enol-lactonase n=1 Tax=Baekduia sp. TaxID=2600305 RepID=UPI002D798DFA|nr:3-oxoadipate enol-lactonase [Baekduia sp.]HET6506467.1 3-oxoadipate enol-lactonase [Baekduia sp.]
MSDILNHEDGGPRDAPALLLAGSLGTTLRMWDPQADVLRNDHGLRVIAYDQLGHGASPVPDGPYSIARLGEAALALMDHLGVRRASFAGVSIGGMVGQWLAAHAPERIDRLVLICTSAHLGAPDPWIERARTVREAGTVGAIADAVVERWLTPPWAAAHPEARDALRAMLAAQPAEGYAACCDALAHLDERADAAAIEAPTLVLGGAQDAAIPPEHQERLAASIAGARLEILDPGAHVVSVERADAVIDLIADHLDRERSTA